MDMVLDGTLGHIDWDAPENYLARLRTAMTGDFPPIGPTQYFVREVHERLQEHTGPAFYLAPAIDRFDQNIIYINPSAISDNLSLFTILAHEGYPGHMYQTVYFLQQSHHPIRISLENRGYDEGWATYVEMMSYYYAGLPENEAALMRHAQVYNLLFISRIDLGVNALGWGINEVAAFCEVVGILEWEVIEDLYATVTANPLFYLPYSLGFIEISLLLEEAQAALRTRFELMEFHRFILDFGSAPFPLIRMHMHGWIAEEQSGPRTRAA
jgi:uncharacterized protein (DUF885 family)